MKKILITAPLRQDPKIFREYQESIDRLVIPEGYTADRFFVVNDCDEVVPEIRNADYVIKNYKDSYEKTSDDHRWTLDNMMKMGYLRNLTICYAIANGYDYWFSADTDLILHPLTLKVLLEADKDIISEGFWTQAKNGVIWCNSWIHDQNDTKGMTEEWRKPGLYQVGMTGALMLVKRKVFEAGADYTRIPNIWHAFVGEDRHFCVRAACLGFEIWMDTHVPAIHLYTEDVYQRYMDMKKMIKEEKHNDNERTEKHETTER